MYMHVYIQPHILHAIIVPVMYSSDTGTYDHPALCHSFTKCESYNNKAGHFSESVDYRSNFCAINSNKIAINYINRKVMTEDTTHFSLIRSPNNGTWGIFSWPSWLNLCIIVEEWYLAVIKELFLDNIIFRCIIYHCLSCL